MDRATRALDRTPLQTGGARRHLALAAVSTLLAGSAFACGTDTGTDDPSASGTSATASGSPSGSASATSGSSPSASPSTSPSTSPSATETPAGDPVPSPVIDRAVRAALADGFPALVPAGVPAGWTVVSATYSAKRGGSWRIALTEPGGGPVRLVQTTQALDELVSGELGVEVQQTGTVDLGSSGTGRWRVYTGGEAAGQLTAIATRIAGTSALVSGPDQDSVVELADQLLTAEDGGGGGGGGYE